MTLRNDIERLLPVASGGRFSPVMLSHVAFALDGKLRRAGTEAQFALRQHLPFSEAVKNVGRFPTLSMLDEKLGDVLGLAQQAERKMSVALTDLRTKLAYIAVAGEGDANALASFALWSLVRLASPDLPAAAADEVQAKLVGDAALHGGLDEVTASLNDILARLLGGEEFKKGLLMGLSQPSKEAGQNG